jgi:hypothetical protein
MRWWHVKRTSKQNGPKKGAAWLIENTGLSDHDPSSITVVAMALARLAPAMLATAITLPVIAINPELHAWTVIWTPANTPAVAVAVAHDRSGCGAGSHR